MSGVPLPRCHVCSLLITTGHWHGCCFDGVGLQIKSGSPSEHEGSMTGSVRRKNHRPLERSTRVARGDIVETFARQSPPDAKDTHYPRNTSKVTMSRALGFRISFVHKRQRTPPTHSLNPRHPLSIETLLERQSLNPSTGRVWGWQDRVHGPGCFLTVEPTNCSKHVC